MLTPSAAGKACAAAMIILPLAWAQGTVPVHRLQAGAVSLTQFGVGPAAGGTTAVRTVLAPVALVFEAKLKAGRPFVMDAAGDVKDILRSPVFTPYPFPGGTAQYADALLRASVAQPGGWHTVLASPRVQPLRITVPVGYGYVLTSKSSGRSLAIADVEFVQREIFKQLPKQPDTLVLAVTRNTAFYAAGDATVCCSWGTHGVDRATGNSFVLGSFLRKAPSLVTDADVQPLTQQLAGFVKDPLHDPLLVGRNLQGPGNTVRMWMWPQAGRGCGGNGLATSYFLLEPTNTNPKNNVPASPAYLARVGGRAYHLQNAALPSWYTGAAGTLGEAYSFPDAQALREPAGPCPPRGGGPDGGRSAVPKPSAVPAPLTQKPNGHKLIGYWAGYGGPGSTIPLRELSPQWDIILIAFSTPDKDAPEGAMKFPTPGGLDKEQFKSDIAWLKSQGKTVMISLGGGGQHFTLADPNRVSNFVESVERIVRDYGFDGIDIDFESPSLSIAPGDTDYRKPTTPSIVNLISAIRQLRERMGPKFLISLVPEGTQIPSGYPSYGGQFGSYLPIAYALRDILTFMDVQDYNTPPLLGLDGEIYQPGTVDYHAAMTELLLHGFPVGGNPKMMFPPMPPEQVAVGFLTGDTTPEIVAQSMEYLITGKAPAGVRYRLRKPGGYPAMLGVMFWTIDADRRENYKFSNVVGPLLHGYPPAR